jgi:hypothetical protein
VLVLAHHVELPVSASLPPRVPCDLPLSFSHNFSGVCACCTLLFFLTFAFLIRVGAPLKKQTGLLAAVFFLLLLFCRRRSQWC